MHARELWVKQRGSTQAQAFTGVGAGGIDVEHRRRAGGEAGGSVGTSQVLKFGIRGDFGWEVMDGHTGIETVGVDFVQVSQAGRTTQRFSVQHPRMKNKMYILYLYVITGPMHVCDVIIHFSSL